MVSCLENPSNFVRTRFYFLWKSNCAAVTREAEYNNKYVGLGVVFKFAADIKEILNDTHLFKQTQENSGSVSMNHEKGKDKKPLYLNQVLNDSFLT